MKRSAFVLLGMLLASAIFLRAQVVPSAFTHRNISLTAGGMGSLFQPDFAGDWVWNTQGTQQTPIAGASPQGLFGVGAFVDVKITHWVQIEAEARWMRLHEYEKIYEDNYLAGPRVPVYRYRGFNLYAKALGGWANVPFGTGLPYHSYTDIAVGGGADYRLTKRINVRAFDFEYQKLLGWPSIGANQSISPYGVSAGVSYRIF